jgi:hypothetical protein
MPRPSLSYDILIASPSDTAAERDVISDCIRDWNSVHAHEGIYCRDVRWELDSVPAVGERSQAILNKQFVDQADLLIGVFKVKFGSATGVSPSGTIEEIERCVKAGKPVMLYFYTGPIPRDHDPEQLQLVKNYQLQIMAQSIYAEFGDLEVLRRKVSRHLGATMANLASDREPVASPSNQKGRGTKSTDGDHSALLADLISELEDNYDRACRPQTGDVYRQPSDSTWLKNRNRIHLPAEIRTQVVNAYHEISSWADVVRSGLHPNTGSMQLNLLVSGLQTSLPSLLAQLRKFEATHRGAEEAKMPRALGPAAVASAPPRRQRSLDFLPDFSPKEIELIATAAKEPNGQIRHMRAVGTEVLYIGKRTFLNPGDARASAEWMGAIRNLVADGFLEEGGRKSNFYTLTDLGWAASDHLEEFARWSTNEVKIEGNYLNAPSDSATIACIGIIQLPAIYFQYRVRADVEVMRSVKEPTSLMVEGVSLKELNAILWEPTHLTFFDDLSKEPRVFPVERTADRKIAKFYISA